MNKKNIVLALIVILSMSISACGEKTENTTDTNKSVNTEENVTKEEGTEENSVNEETYEYPSEQVEPIEYESDMGYSLIYDPSIITLDDTGEGDKFSYNTSEKLDAPVYISVMNYSDMDIETLTDGIILQSGIDGLKAETTYFGADNIEIQCIYIENDVDGVTQIQIFYVIPMSEGCMVVEIGGYIGAPANVDATINEMLGTFRLK